MNFVDAVARYRLLVCVGAGGVGKTTIAASLALAAAQRGRRALVLTIDPARALARALGLDRLAADRQRVGVAVPGTLDAAMLDPRHAWDAFVSRHAPSPAIARTLLTNPFYRRLSSSFAGSTEYMAIEEMCRFAESGDYDLIVLDTPPAAHSLDFLAAPERIDRLLGLRSFGWTAWRSAGATARFVLRQLERATGKGTLRDIVAFFAALDTLVGAMATRTEHARALLSTGDAAFVLVSAPRELVLEETRSLAAKLAVHAAPLAGIVINRVHPLPAVERETAARALAGLGDTPAARWLRGAWTDAIAEASDETRVIAQLGALASPALVASVAEADHDLHALADLAFVVRELAHQPSTATTMPVTTISEPAATSP